MSDEQMQSLLDTWYQDRVVPRPKVEAGVAKVMADASRTQQQSRQWPLVRLRRRRPGAAAIDHLPDPNPATHSDAPTVIGRTRIMLSPAKAIIGGAFVFALGAAFVVSQPFDQRVVVPGADSGEGGGLGVVTRFEGTMNYGPESDAGVQEMLPNGDFQGRGRVWTLLGVEMTDPRLDGVVTSMWDVDQRVTRESVGVAAGGFRIENDDGAWQMRPITNFTLDDGTYSTWTGVLDGEGGYEGLTAVVEVVEGATGYSLRGIIVEGELPPPPGSRSGD